MSKPYQTRVTAIGGRTGTVRSEDGILNLQLAMPKELGVSGDATNPEQLFAAGYAACFGNAVIYVTRSHNRRIQDNEVEVVGQVGLATNDQGGFRFLVTLEVKIANVDQAEAEEIVRAAHLACPYSNAIKGNVDVQFKVAVR